MSSCKVSTIMFKFHFADLLKDCIAHFIKPYQIQCICKLDFGKVLWNGL